MNTLAIVLGASQFDNHPGFASSTGGPAFKTSADKIKALMWQRCEVGEEANILDLFDSPEDALTQITKIREFLKMHRGAAQDGKRTEVDNLVLYYVGHGAFTSTDSYFLALRTTDEESPEYTGLSVQALVKVLSTHFSGSTYIVLDCCFAGAIVDSFMSDDGFHSVVEKDIATKVKDSGVAVLCASSKHDVASSLGQGDMTQFSECLAEVLESGDKRVGEWLTFRDVGKETKRLVVERYGNIGSPPEVHSPVQGRGDTDPSDRPLFKNYSWNPSLEDFDERLANSLLSDDHFARSGGIVAIESILSNERENPVKKSVALAALESRLEATGGERDFQLREDILKIVSTYSATPDAVESKIEEPVVSYPSDHRAPIENIPKAQVQVWVGPETGSDSRALIWSFTLGIVGIPAAIVYFFVFGETFLSVQELIATRNLVGLVVASVLLGGALFFYKPPRSTSFTLFPLVRIFAIAIISLLIVANASTLDNTEGLAIVFLIVVVMAHEYWMMWLQVTARVRSILGNSFLLIAMAFCLAATAEEFSGNEYLTIFEGIVGLIIWSALPTRHRKIKLSDDVILKFDSIKNRELRKLFRVRYGAAAPIQSNLAVNRIMNRTYLSVEAYLGGGKLLAGFANLVWSGDGPAEVDYIVTRERVNRIALDLVAALEDEARDAGIKEIQISDKALHDSGLRELIESEHGDMGYDQGLCYTKLLITT